MKTTLELLKSNELSHEQMEELAERAGLSIEEAQASLLRRQKKLEYRKEYNSRGERKAYRKNYNLIRKIKEEKAINAFKSLLKK